MKTRKTANIVWTLINLILILGEAITIWAILSNEQNSNLGLWNFVQGKFFGFSIVEGLPINFAKVVVILVSLVVFSMTYASVRANLIVGKFSIDFWCLWNMVVTAIIVVSVIGRYRYYFMLYEDQCKIAGTGDYLKSERAIVHGAGWIEDAKGNIYDYTNSLDALTNSYDMGNRVIEMDFLWTSDEKMVCAHESETFARGIDSDGPLSEKEFLESKNNGMFTTMNIQMLADFMYEHDDLYIVTDFKYDLPESCQYIAQVYPDLRDRFIVQMYHYSQYEYIRELGFNNIILTLYLLDEEENNIERLCDFVKTHDLVAITFWEYYMDNNEVWMNGEDFFGIIRSLNIPICVHTVNDEISIRNDIEAGVTAVYTDRVDNEWIRDIQ